MAVLRCTKKLLAELKITSVSDISDEDMLSSWHANFFRIERRKCVLLTHSTTLYCVLITCMRKHQFEFIGSEFRDRLYSCMRWDAFPESHLDAMLDAHRNFVFTKTNSRSVLGSMNDLIYQARVDIAYSGGVLSAGQSAVSCQLNRTPMSAIGGGYAVDSMRKLLRERFDQTE